MNIADLYRYLLRMVLAIPTGLAFTQLSARNVAAFVAFGLGAFPLDAILKQLRRFTNKSVGAEEEKQNPDQLVQLEGVTVAISTQLAAEGIDSIDELVGTDPILLSVRSGVPLASILRFASQAVVRIHFGERATELVPLALGNAYLITQLVEDLDRNLGGAERRLQDATARLRKDTNATVPSLDTVRAGFRAVAEHGYTKFLKAVADA